MPMTQDHLPERPAVTPSPPMLPSGIRPWTESRYERMYDPGQVPVYPGEPLPQRDPMRALADWGAPPSPPYRLDDERAYASPGPPPWASRSERDLAAQHGWRPGKRTGVPAWTLAAIALGLALVVLAGTFLARIG